MPLSSIAQNFDLIVDPRVGMVNRVEELPREPGAPDFVHYLARSCNTHVFFAHGEPSEIATAGVTREAAILDAVSAALARYSGGFYDREALRLTSFAEADFPCVKPGDFALYDESQYALAGFPWVRFAESTPVRWTPTLDLSSGETVHLPAAFVLFPFEYFRQAEDQPIGAPTSVGLACADGAPAAVLAGLSAIIRNDALAIFWQAAQPSPRVRIASLPDRIRVNLRRFERAGDRIDVLDGRTDNHVPTFIVSLASDNPDRPAYVFAAASDLDPSTALLRAFDALAEARRRAVVAMREPPPSPANDWEDVIGGDDHLAFAADHANRSAFAFAFRSDDLRDFATIESLATGSVESDLETCLARIHESGHRAYVANLTSPDVALLGLAVCRTVVPGYHPLLFGHRLRALGGDRIYDVPQRLGYRGILRGSGGNPAPHPFG